MRSPQATVWRWLSVPVLLWPRLDVGKRPGPGIVYALHFPFPSKPSPPSGERHGAGWLPSFVNQEMGSAQSCPWLETAAPRSWGYFLRRATTC